MNIDIDADTNAKVEVWGWYKCEDDAATMCMGANLEVIYTWPYT